MEWRDGLGKALQVERPDKSTSNGPISDFVAAFITDAAEGDTCEGDLPSHGHNFSLPVLFSLQEDHGQLANPTQNPFSCFVFCH